MRVEIITIGDEILIGQIIDSNSAWMAKELNKIGIRVTQVSSVADDQTDIQQALELAQGRADVVLITGGLGPTKDDVTKKALCTYFGRGLRRDQGVLDHVTAIFEKFNRPMLDINRQQADVLEGSDVLFNALGTAPGMWIHHANKHFISMPGVPYEMKHIMENHVLPRLEKLEGRQPIWHHTILTGGIGESFLSKEIRDIEDNLPAHFHLAYLPKPGTVRLRLTASGKDHAMLQKESESIVRKLRERLGHYFLANDDTTVEALIIDALHAANATMTTAESCTGGNIAKTITSLPGASAVFPGGVVTYSNELKMQLLGVSKDTLERDGAVSERTVREMATGAREHFHADYAVSTSGIAGPNGGTPEKPVGLVWIAIANKDRVIAKAHQFGHDRDINTERATAAALLMLLRMIKEDGKAKNSE